MIITINSKDTWYVGNPVALGEYFEDNKETELLNQLLNTLRMFGMSRADPQASHNLIDSIVRGKSTTTNPDLFEVIGMVVLMTCRAGRLGTDYGVCVDFGSGRLRTCDPGERFGTVLYESKGDNTSLMDIEEACRRVVVGLGA